METKTTDATKEPWACKTSYNINPLQIVLRELEARLLAYIENASKEKEETEGIDYHQQHILEGKIEAFNTILNFVKNTR
jgi:hypothetical protein